MSEKQCPTCKFTSGDNWEQCNGVCPMPMSPHYKPNEQMRQKWLDLNENLCRRYNETDDESILERIAFTELVLLNWPHTTQQGHPADATTNGTAINAEPREEGV